MDEKKEFKKAKNMFDALKVDPSSVSFSEEVLDKKLLNKLKSTEIKIRNRQAILQTCKFNR